MLESIIVLGCIRTQATIFENSRQLPFSSRGLNSNVCVDGHERADVIKHRQQSLSSRLQSMKAHLVEYEMRQVEAALIKELEVNHGPFWYTMTSAPSPPMTVTVSPGCSTGAMRCGERQPVAAFTGLISCATP